MTEDLRNIILAHLNGHLKGMAAGEVFRKKGKTDIRIEYDDRSAFVAECKVWRGEKEFHDSIDQLLGYLTWRDCKAAIIIFNKHNSGFTEIIRKIPEHITEHPRFCKDTEEMGEGEWRYIFNSKEDDLKKVYVHIFAFDIFCCI